ncbi:MAG: hypothetical protein AB1749_10470 [Pseudomonadota bacterium]
MARAAAHNHGLDNKLVNRFAGLLAAAKTDSKAFEATLAELSADPRLKAPEIVAIAKAYAGSSKRVTSKAAAMEAIRKRFVELVRFEAKNALAAKSRPW